MKQEQVKYQQKLFELYSQHTELYKDLTPTNYFSLYPLRYSIFYILINFQNFLIKRIEKYKPMSTIFAYQRIFVVKKYGFQSIHPSKNLVLSKVLNIRYLIYETCVFLNILIRLWKKRKLH